MEKINVAELLSNCPKGMELDCIMFEGSVVFEDISEDDEYPIGISTKSGEYTNLTKYGQYLNLEEAKCVIFPKGKTTWEGFQRPFKDGDVIYNKGINALAIFYKQTDDCTVSHCFLNTLGKLMICHYHSKDLSDWKFATEEEKEKLFKAIKDNGYKWNSETKTLDKLIQPKFKVGDRIILKDNPHNMPSIRIKAITTCQYILENEGFLYIDSTDEKYVLEDRFNITTLKPFDRVLVRTKNFHDEWIAGFFSHKDSYVDFAPFWTTADKNYQQCIPYEGNEHLLGTTDDCDEYFKTWK